MDKLSEQTKSSKRKRAHFNLHKSMDEAIHRLCMAAEPGTYVRPHRHLSGDKWELFTILRGQIVVLIFDEKGYVVKRVELTAGGDIGSIEIPASSWHTFACLESDSIILEVKSGPYMRPVEGDWLAGTPEEGKKGAKELEQFYQKAQVGDKLKS
ncbi:MAG: WbuC family cupin fold metalloprotein [Victivallales bacterium]|nr:WbuC family cupin fold metalloprotein [Victivallales bacterium]